MRLENMEFYAFHGVGDAEKEVGQRFGVEVELRTSLLRPGESDLHADAIDYVGVYQKVRDVVEGDSCNLLEALAHKVAEALLQDRRIDSVSVRVSKQPPLRASFGTFAVEIERSRPGN